MMQKATLFGGSVVVGPHDLNDQYHFTTSLLFPKIEKEWKCYGLWTAQKTGRERFIWIF